MTYNKSNVPALKNIQTATGVHHPYLHTRRGINLKWLGSKIVNLVIYALLLEIIFIFLYPYLYMLVNSLKFEVDLNDLTRQWVIEKFNFDTYTTVLKNINYFEGLKVNLVISLACAAGHVLSAAFIAYGLARFDFPGKNIIFGLVIFALIVPPQIFCIPLYVQYSKWGWVKTLAPIIVPTFFGFGLKGGLFIFIFRQYYIGLHKSYEEAARLEGLGEVSIFFRIVLPISSSSILVTSILSIVWHWNDYFEPTFFLKGKVQMLSQLLAGLNVNKYVLATAYGKAINPWALAGCVLATLPLLVIFLIFQKRFIQGVENSGLAN